MLDTVVISGDDVCCSVVFGTLVGDYDNDNDKSLFSKLRPLLRHIRDTSIYKYNNNYSKKSTIRWKNINATNIQIIIKYKFFYMVAHFYGIFPYPNTYVYIDSIFIFQNHIDLKWVNYFYLCLCLVLCGPSC